MPCVVTSEGLTAAVNERLKYPGRTEAEAMNHAAYSVALGVNEHTPFAPPEKIDTELKVSANHYITKSGQLSKRKRISHGMGDKQTDVPLTALIVMARANPSSNYNQRTNSRYALDKNPFKGVSRAAGRAAMKELVRKMVALRHKSSKFIRSGWIPAMKTLGAVVKDKTGSVPDDFYEGTERGGAVPAVEGSWQVEATIENRTGLEGVNAANANKALMIYGEPALEQAMADEEARTRDYIEKKLKPLNDKFNAMNR